MKTKDTVTSPYFVRVEQTSIFEGVVFAESAAAAEAGLWRDDDTYKPGGEEKVITRPATVEEVEQYENGDSARKPETSND